MTFDDDFIQLQTESGPRRIWLKTINAKWPPQPVIDLCGFRFKRTRMSEITDEERAGMSHVCRGAEYIPDTEGKGP